MILPSPAPFTKEELETLFPDGVPVLLVKLLFPSASEELTVGDLRQIARALAAHDKSEQTPPPSTHLRGGDE